ncbi:Rieske (2Fe-2S) protein [Streptomyces spectabilis]|uniref:Cytochrome bc1 complex Rieske iron-sulfur subunit n=1 Tax=Streptomyces spectabilis TaxID=68270 RepID=A0A5P2X935_STRST|nr:Rieske (2Fe-2S) protein [Streptomyces spectabilis]MBB5106123.1 Rieske Fe-S protein [Streptomyces spectabilis]MCI3901653.1 Rieske (2Fe-2S) protein [Streptomyces spectabilis]QEV59096.1 Rieske (2Fe-2S) protein [Streptomyces spectabilis]GGV52844.1 iron-sulfur protein [Streptomyces spectabilis]
MSGGGRPTRRAALAAAALAAAAAACDKYGDEGAEPDPPESTPPSSGGGAPGERPAKAPPLAKTSEVPVGGGKVFKDEKVVVTQPEKGDFKAFSAICTHQGCTVRDVSDGTINCPCHGSRFSVADASVTDGPAPRALAPRGIDVTGNAIRLT